MTEEEAILVMQKWIDCGDIEIAHCEADKLLCKFLEKNGYEKLVEEWRKVRKWYA